MAIRLKLVHATVAAVLLVLPFGAAHARSEVPKSLEQVQLSFAPIVKRVAPPVVTVSARSVVRQQVNPFFSDPLFQHFFGISPKFRMRI